LRHYGYPVLALDPNPYFPMRAILNKWPFLKGLVLSILLSFMPLNWSIKDWSRVILAVGGTLAVMTLDQDIKDFIHVDLELLPQDVVWLEKGLNGRSLTIYMTVAYLGGLALKNNLVTRVTLMCAESFVLSGAVGQVIKYSVGRHRPKTGDSPWTWDGPQIEHSSSKSFPSGHTTVAFAIATTLILTVRQKWVGGLGYFLAVLTAITRVVKKQHWTSDVLFGAIIGYFVARQVVRFHEQWREEPPPLTAGRVPS